jgi:hypothetical protein
MLMHRSCLKIAAAALFVAVLFAGAAERADTPFAGNWKLLDVDDGNEKALVLLQVSEKDGKPQATVLASPLLGEEKATIDNLKVDAKSMQFDVTFAAGIIHAKAYREARGKPVVGWIEYNGKLLVAQFNPTDDTTLAEDDAVSQTAEGEQLENASKLDDAKEKQAALKELVDKRTNTPAAYKAGRLLLKSYVEEGANDADSIALAGRLVKLAARYGPEIETNAAAVACHALARGDKVSPEAVAFARNAEKTLYRDGAPLPSANLLKGLARLLIKTGKENEAKALEPRIDKLEEIVDAEYEKTAVPFKTEAFKGREGDGKRVAVVELFTGAYCPPCVAADVAFDAGLQTFKPTDVIFLQYHVHIPARDRLTNADTEKRMNYYGNSVDGTPTGFVNGSVTKQLGGLKSSSKDSFDTLRDAVEDALKLEVAAALKVKVERKGDKLDITGEVRNLRQRGEKVKLRFVLVEDVVRYPGGNGQRLHHHIVRAFPGGADGVALPDVEDRKSVTIDLADLKKTLDQYMTDINKSNRPFVDDEYPLSLKRLKVIALIQDDANREILQAAQIDVPDAK